MKAKLKNDNTIILTAESVQDSSFLERIGGARLLFPSGTFSCDAESFRTTSVEYEIGDWH